MARSDLLWEQAGLHPIEPEPGPYEHRHARWWKFLDDDAPGELEGKRIEYLISSVDGKPQVTGRRPVP